MIYIIYRISIADYNYIGSTKDFKQRKQKHKKACNNVNDVHHNLKVYQMIRENGGWSKCEMVPIEECECETTIQAHIREEELRKEYNAEMNSYKAYLGEDGKKEYYEANKETILQHNKEYYEANKETILQKQKEYKEAKKETISQKYTCECGSVISIGHKSQHVKTKKHCDYINSLVVATA